MGAGIRGYFCSVLVEEVTITCCRSRKLPLLGAGKQEKEVSVDFFKLV